MTSPQWAGVVQWGQMVLTRMIELDGMALLTLCTKLPAMEIGMAVRTFRTHVLEHQLDVARPAFDLLVRTAQWIARPVVVKVGNSAERLPTGEGVAILAADFSGPVWVPRGCGLLALGLSCLRGLARGSPRSLHGERQYPKQNL